MIRLSIILSIVVFLTAFVSVSSVLTHAQPLLRHSSVCSKDDNPDDCSALQDFAKALNYDKWTKNDKWMSSSSVCDWYGVKCKDGRVEELSLEANGLDGSLPDSLHLLSELTEFKITGSRPDSYKGCKDTNLHNSSIPESFYSLKKLNNIDMEYCCLGGGISPSIGQLKDLSELQLHGNYLTGPVPGSVGQLRALTVFKVGRNPLSGNFPNVSAPGLLKLDGNFCAFTGPIPDFFDQFPDLQQLFWDGNGFSGSLPASLGALKSLQSVSFNINNLDGSVPSGLCDLKDLDDCRIGSDTDPSVYQADYPWLIKVKGNLYDCPVPSCASSGGKCDKTDGSTPSPVKCNSRNIFLGVNPTSS